MSQFLEMYLTLIPPAQPMLSYRELWPRLRLAAKRLRPALHCLYNILARRCRLLTRIRFHVNYLHHVPIFEGTIHPNACFSHCELLFWTIMTVGARGYVDDPTLLTSLVNPVADLAGKASLRREKPLPTIQALILLCAWTLPHDSFSTDVSPLLVGTLLQLALTIGLHVYGIGQAFSRMKLKADRAHIQHRSRLWYLCVTVCQRSFRHHMSLC